MSASAKKHLRARREKRIARTTFGKQNPLAATRNHIPHANTPSSHSFLIQSHKRYPHFTTKTARDLPTKDAKKKLRRHIYSYNMNPLTISYRSRRAAGSGGSPNPELDGRVMTLQKIERLYHLRLWGIWSLC